MQAALQTVAKGINRFGIAAPDGLEAGGGISLLAIYTARRIRCLLYSGHGMQFAVFYIVNKTADCNTLWDKR